MKTRPGEMRATTIKDARELGLFPSVTTVLQLISKPGLDSWRIEQGIRAVLAHPFDGDDLDEYISRMLLRADDERNRAADFGTEIHNAVCNMLGGQRHENPDTPYILAKPIAEGVCEWLARNGYEVVATEQTVVGKEYAGTIDLRAYWHGKRVLCDFKTSEFSAKKGPNSYAEHRYQLAGYDSLLENWAEERHIIYISRSEIGLVVAKPCVEPSHDDLVWEALWSLWTRINRWNVE